MEMNDLTYQIIGGAIKVHRELGPGLLESVYEYAMSFELNEIGLQVRRQVPMPMIYKNTHLETGYRVDLIVEERVIIEIKSVDALAPVHFAQVLTYLKLSGLKLGLLINFNTYAIKNDIHRIVNNL